MAETLDIWSDEDVTAVAHALASGMLLADADAENMRQAHARLLKLAENFYEKSLSNTDEDAAALSQIVEIKNKFEGAMRLVLLPLLLNGLRNNTLNASHSARWFTELHANPADQLIAELLAETFGKIEAEVKKGDAIEANIKRFKQNLVNEGVLEASEVLVREAFGLPDANTIAAQAARDKIAQLLPAEEGADAYKSYFKRVFTPAYREITEILSDSSSLAQLDVSAVARSRFYVGKTGADRFVAKVIDRALSEAIDVIITNSSPTRLATADAVAELRKRLEELEFPIFSEQLHNFSSSRNKEALIELAGYAHSRIKAGNAEIAALYVNALKGVSTSGMGRFASMAAQLEVMHESGTGRQ